MVGVPLTEVSSLCPGFDVKGSCSCFDSVVGHADFNIHGSDRGGTEKEERNGEENFGQTES